MELVNKLLYEVHSARMFLQHNRPEKVKLAVYINELTRRELRRELFHEVGIAEIPSRNISLINRRGEKNHVFGYPVYEVIGQDETPWNIVEIPEIPN